MDLKAIEGKCLGISSSFDPVTNTYSLWFELYGLPRMLNPSGRRTNHFVVAQEKKRWRASVFRAVCGTDGRGAKPSHQPEHPLKYAQLKLLRHSSTSPDPDNLVGGFKPIIDGLVDAGVLVNDKWENIGMPTYGWRYAKKSYGKIEIFVSSLSEPPHCA